MSEIIDAVFDGEVFHPDKPVKLKPNTRVKIVVELPPSSTKKASFLSTAKSLKLEGPADWSENLDDYLYHGKRIDTE